MLVSKIGCRLSAVGCRNVCALIRNNNRPRNIYALADNLHVFADLTAGRFLCLASLPEAAS